MLHLTGLTQPETVLVLMPGNKTRREVLFVREPDAHREHREGHVLTKDEASAASGVGTVYYISEFEPFLTAMVNRRAYGDPVAGTQEHATFFAAVASGRASLALPLGPSPPPSAPLSAHYEFANKARERFWGVTIADTWNMLADLRQVKSPFEVALLEQSGVISSDAHLAGMRVARPGRSCRVAR
jgi:Xaa-Pro aminopeptidase